MSCWLGFANESTKLAIGRRLSFLGNANHFSQRRFSNAIPFADAMPSDDFIVEEIGDEVVKTELDDMLERDERGQSELAVTK